MVQRRQGIRLYQPPVRRRCFRAFFGHPSRRLSQPARRPGGRVRGHQGAEGLPGRKRPTYLIEDTSQLPGARSRDRAFFLRVPLVEVEAVSRRERVAAGDEREPAAEILSAAKELCGGSEWESKAPLNSN